MEKIRLDTTQQNRTGQDRTRLDRRGQERREVPGDGLV